LSERVPRVRRMTQKRATEEVERVMGIEPT